MDNNENSSNNQEVEILAVEDSLTQQLQLQNILEKNGYKVALASNGKEAIEFVEKRKPSIVITDIVMPEMNGFQLCSQIKNDERFCEIPVILLTSLSDPGDIIRGLECRANNFITKPYNEESLLCRIQYILMNRHLRTKEMAEIGLEIFFRGKKHLISSDRMQIIDLLFSSFESALEKNQELLVSNKKLKEALNTVQTLKGLIPICSSCKKIRDDKGFWQQVEEYIVQHSNANFTHGICPECTKELYPEFKPKGGD